VRTILRLFNLRSRDKRGLLLLGPLFALVTCANVVTLSFTKAFFVANNEIDALPWMFLGASVFTAALSMLYLRLITKGTRTGRFHFLLLTASFSFIVFGFALGSSTSGMALALFTWTSGMGHLILIQTWAFSGVLLPTRQAKRLFPVFAASATIGAALGGALVRAIASHSSGLGILTVAAALLLAASFTLSNASRRISSSGNEEEKGQATKTTGEGALSNDAGFRGVLRYIRENSLLRATAILVFGLQLASVFMDYQFTAALKIEYPDEAELAGFFGLYYGVANLMTLGLALLSGSRLTRWFGIGVAASFAALILLFGSTVSAFLFVAEHEWLVWAIIVTSFLERVTSFGIGRHAIQAAMSPIEQNTAERAKFVIEGVIYKSATILVSIFFIFVPAILSSPGQISWVIVLSAGVAVFAGLRLGVNYREHIRVGLGNRRVFAFDAATSWARREALHKVRPLLVSKDREENRHGLEYIRDLKVELSTSLMKHLFTQGDADTALETLSVLAHTGQEVPSELLLTFLDIDVAPEHIQAALRLVPSRDDAYEVALHGLLEHTDPVISSLAAMRLGTVRSKGFSVDEAKKHELNLLRSIIDPSPGEHEDAFSEISRLGLTDYIPHLVDLLENQDLRRQAITTLGQLPTPDVVKAIDHRIETSPNIGIALQVWMVHVLEALGTPEALSHLAQRLRNGSETVRGQAVHALWRLSRFPERFELDSTVMSEVIHDELERLGRLTFLSALLSIQDSERIEFVRREVAVLQEKGERRVFRLLGVVTNRDTIERVFQYYRDPDKRTRSNAIELLDHTLGTGPYRAFVEYIEATEVHDGFKTTLRHGSRFQQQFVQALSKASVSSEDPAIILLGDDSAWLKRLYLWAREESGKIQALSPFEEELLNRVLLMHRTPVFQRISGSELAILANVARPVEFEPDETIFWQDDVGDAVYIITEGTADVIFDGEKIATMNVKDCFGEMALVERSTRSATVRVTHDGYLRGLRISNVEFQDMLQIYPSIAKGVVTILVQRLRRALEAKDQRQETRSRFKATLTSEILLPR
jgi:ATP/ADP translocase